MKNISLLGATGSIGTQTMDVVLSHPEELRVTALAFGSNVKLGLEMIKKLQPELVAVSDDRVRNE
ncbi:MAG TPA: 1-deoxy-D-xylulose-5-phosphate reductoisomerase, partial [Sporolactobacillaceae bacterium]|nr:1-deoxy-D-xylulose-5-phosphate reductoisomerase [Sporolactobacillaceae bacterium]